MNEIWMIDTDLFMESLWIFFVVIHMIYMQLGFLTLHNWPNYGGWLSITVHYVYYSENESYMNCLPISCYSLWRLYPVITHFTYWNCCCFLTGDSVVWYCCSLLCETKDILQVEKIPSCEWSRWWWWGK